LALIPSRHRIFRSSTIFAGKYEHRHGVGHLRRSSSKRGEIWWVGAGAERRFFTLLPNLEAVTRMARQR
jgi:hypothetical protein